MTAQILVAERQGVRAEPFIFQADGEIGHEWGGTARVFTVGRIGRNGRVMWILGRGVLWHM